ncbi:Rieske (2Fe-2S) protein, partial [Streptomyces sp. NPDC058427]
LELAVRGAVEAAAPEITSIEVETAAGDDNAAGPLVPVDSLFARLHADAAAVGADGASWEVVPELPGLESGAVARVEVGRMPVVACRVGTDLFAFEDRCARCERPFDGATLARRLGGGAGDAVLRCATCRAHYDVRRAGVCLDEDGGHLAPLPLLADGATVCVSVPAAVAP